MFAADRITTASVTVSAAAVAAPTDFFGAHISGANAATVVIYDNASAASGTILASLANPANGGDGVMLPSGRYIPCKNGIYVNVVAGTLGTCVVYTSG